MIHPVKGRQDCGSGYWGLVQRTWKRVGNIRSSRMDVALLIALNREKLSYRGFCSNKQSGWRCYYWRWQQSWNSKCNNRPCEIGKSVIIAQSVTISGLNHNYENISLPIKDQGVSTAVVLLETKSGSSKFCHTQGVSIGKHSVIAAGALLHMMYLNIR
jgi:hypothetical protein